MIQLQPTAAIPVSLSRLSRSREAGGSVRFIFGACVCGLYLNFPPASAGGIRQNRSPSPLKSILLRLTHMGRAESRALAAGRENPAIPKNGIAATKSRASQSSRDHDCHYILKSSISKERMCCRMSHQSLRGTLSANGEHRRTLPVKFRNFSLRTLPLQTSWMQDSGGRVGSIRVSEQAKKWKADEGWKRLSSQRSWQALRGMSPSIHTSPSS